MKYESMAERMAGQVDYLLRNGKPYGRSGNLGIIELVDRAMKTANRYGLQDVTRQEWTKWFCSALHGEDIQFSCDVFGNFDWRGYLITETWNEKKAERLIIAKNRCELCGRKFDEKNKPHCHHVHSDSYGNEDVENDIAVICKSCHDALHRRVI